MENNVQNTVWEASGLEDGADGPEAAWGYLRTFKDAGVAGGEGIRYGAEAENEGGIPEDSMRKWELWEDKRGILAGE